MSTHRVIVQGWGEGELGWGTRPDGYSLHLSEADRVAFIKSYWDGMPASAPPEYSRPDGTPYEALVSDKVFAEVKRSANGTRHNGNPPGSSGVDGWVPARR